jgi:hypothetical protein
MKVKELIEILQTMPQDLDVERLVPDDRGAGTEDVYKVLGPDNWWSTGSVVIA